MINTRLTNSDGHEPKIFDDGSILTVKSSFPPFTGFVGKQKMRVFRQFLTDDGTASGDQDMRVDGSTTNQDFFVKAQDEDDLYITTLAFTISDATATLNNFGTLSPLTNGCVLKYEDEKGTVTIHDSLKTNYDFVQLCLGNPAFGDGAGAFRANNVSGTSEGYLPILDTRAVFGFEWGVLLRAGTNQKFTLTIRDDLSAVPQVDRFDCIAYGFTREED